MIATPLPMAITTRRQKQRCDTFINFKGNLTNLKSKHELDWCSSGNDAVAGMVDKQEV